MKFLLFDDPYTISKDLMVQYLKKKGLEHFYYSYNEKNARFRLVPEAEVEYTEKNNWYDFISFKNIGETVEEKDNPYDYPDTFNPDLNELRMDKVLIDIVEQSSYDEYPTVIIKEVEPGTIFKIKTHYELDNEYLEVFDIKDWITAAD